MLTVALPSICFAGEATDSLVLSRIWSFRRNFTPATNGIEQNVYMRYTIDAKRRNAILFLIPTMHSIAHGQRQFIGETYGKLKFDDDGNYSLHRQVVCGTIPHNRRVMSMIMQHMAPNLYDVALYPDHLLSPFHRANRHYYRYTITAADSKTAVITFRPTLRNTQLVSGRATCDVQTGRLTFVSFSIDYDMVSFSVTATMSEHLQSLLPDRCNTDCQFNFAGNKIEASFTAYYNCEVSLPDSVSEYDSREMMGSLRPVALKKSDWVIYARSDSTVLSETAAKESADSIEAEGSRNRLDEIAWNFIDDNLFSSLGASAGAASVHMSPLINPAYISYSGSKGFSYKLALGATYAWNAHRYLTLNPQLGYNFKQRQVYYTVPLRMTYNPKRNGFAEILWANGNRISNGQLNDDISRQFGDSVATPEFKDEYLKVVNNIQAFDWLEITTGIVYHYRHSTNKALTNSLGVQGSYRSFAPLLTVKLAPWAAGPTLTANYERSIDNVLQSNLAYERWELDAAYKHKLPCLRQLNLRAGAGFYTQRKSTYFVDYDNFRDENIATGWDDDWTGQFQLADPMWYNSSRYYLRSHLSYESPLMMLTWVPWAGQAIEKERIYISTLSIEHKQLYSELGYGLTNRFFSAGIFTGFLGLKAQKLGCKFTIELFKRW